MLERNLMVLIGAALGGWLRYAVADEIARRYGGPFPLGTFVVNITGCFLIGVVMTYLSSRLGLHPNWRFFVVAGFLGGYTTFSSFMWENHVAVRQGSHVLAVVYLMASVALGYAATLLGAALAGKP